MLWQLDRCTPSSPEWTAEKGLTFNMYETNTVMCIALYFIEAQLPGWQNSRDEQPAWSRCDEVVGKAMTGTSLGSSRLI